MVDFKRVLVIDDDIDIAQLLKQKLSQLGYEVDIHCTAKGATEAARAFHPHLVILDVMLGDGIGYQVARAIRKDPLLYKTPLMFQSVLDEERDIAHAYAEGGDRYLTKPYSAEHLVENLEKMRRLHNETYTRCPVTGLHSLALLRREIDHRLFRGEPFALFYIVMEGITSLHQKIDHDEIGHISASIAHTVQKVINDQNFFEVMPCHLGGGYFMVLTKLDDRARFRTCLGEAFVPTTQKAFTHTKDDKLGLGRTYIPGNLLAAYTHTERKKYLYASQMIEDLKRADGQWKVRTPQKSHDAGHTSWLD